MWTPRRRLESTGLNLTPMIDVVFQLLIFFVCTVEFQRPEEKLAARLPPPSGRTGSTASPQELDLGRIDILIRARSITTRFQGREHLIDHVGDQVDLQPLRSQLRAWAELEPRIPVRISGSAAAPTGLVLRVYDVAVQSGMKDVGLLETKE